MYASPSKTALRGWTQTTWLVKPKIFTLGPFMGNLLIPVLNLWTGFSCVIPDGVLRSWG